MKMLGQWFKKIFQNSQSDHTSRLLVFYCETLVGVLSIKNGKYLFRYDENCPEKYKVKGLTEGIASEFLPPFFTTRLPSRSRPDLINSFKDLPDDPIAILGHLSAESPISPYKFRLEEAD